MLIPFCRGDRLGSHTPANVSDAVLEEAEEIPWKLGIGKSSGFVPVDLDLDDVFVFVFVILFCVACRAWLLCYWNGAR